MKTELVISLADLNSRSEQLRISGRTIIPYDRPEFGRVAFVAFHPKPDNFAGNWTEADEDGIRVTFYPFGKKMTPKVDYSISAEAMETALMEHGSHPGFRKFANPVDRQVGFLCYCQADSLGLCRVYTGTLVMYKELREEFRRLIEPSDTPVGI